ncbi:MAG: PilZ domain-containing protein [Planctomycetota bacterium]
MQAASLTVIQEIEKLESLQQTNPNEASRRFVRFIIRGDAELRPAGPNRSDTEPLKISLRDVSRGGLGFLAERPIEVGTFWRCGFGDDGLSVGEMSCIVRRCRPVGPNLFLVGADIVVPIGLLMSLGVSPGCLEGLYRDRPADSSPGFCEPRNCSCACADANGCGPVLSSLTRPATPTPATPRPAAPGSPAPPPPRPSAS